MGDRRRARCRACGRHRDEVGELSWTGLCAEDARRLSDEANDDLHFHRGPVFALWRQRMAECVGGVLLDERPPEP